MVQLGGFDAQTDGDHFNDGDVIIVNRNAAFVFGIPEHGRVAHVGRIRFFVVVGDRVIAELFRYGVKFAVDIVKFGRAYLRENIIPGKVLGVQRLQQTEFDHPFDVDAVHHENIPVPRLGLFEKRQGYTGSVVLFHIDAHVVFLFERSQQGGVGVVAPGQDVQLLTGGQGRCCGNN